MRQLTFIVLALAIGIVIGRNSSESVFASAPQAGPPRVKEDKSFQREWEKLRRTTPIEFDKQKAQFLVMAQMDLGKFGYGTKFTGTLDENTIEALRAYQSKRGIPASGDLDPLTIDQLKADADLFEQPEIYLSPFQFLADSWDKGALVTSGSWVEDGKTEPGIESSSIECYQDWGLCIDGQALMNKMLGSVTVVGKFEAYRIHKWDKFEVVADSVYPQPCERDSLRINRQEKSVTLLSIPAYVDTKTCENLLGAPKTITVRLVDGDRITKPRNDAKAAAVRSLLQLSDKARALLYAR